jgi:signal transduction histidine kinase
VQEALTNVLRHADASTPDVRVAIGSRNVEIDVHNDSLGPPTDAPVNGAGRGLRGMAERAEALGGRIEAGPRPEGGWRVHAVLPLSS